MRHDRDWAYAAGRRGVNRVRARIDAKTGMIFLDFFEARAGHHRLTRRRVSLGHRDRQRAVTQANEMAATLTKRELLPGGIPSLGALIALYLEEVSPHKGRESTRAFDQRTAAMFLRYWQRERNPLTLGKRDFDAFIHDRRNGRISPRQRSSPEVPRSVGPRAAAHDLKWLNSVFNWATVAGDGHGGVLLERNPFKGFALPKELNPRRPSLSAAEYEAIRVVAPSIGWRFHLVLILAHETGHRVSAIRQLRWSDVDLERHVVTWRASNDKIGFEHATPLTDEAVAALSHADQHHRSEVSDWIVPAPRKLSAPVCRGTLDKAWRRACREARVESLSGRGWHCIRRKFATELKRIPLKDLADLGGWKAPATILECYQQSDLMAMREALRQRKQA